MSLALPCTIAAFFAVFSAACITEPPLDAETSSTEAAMETVISPPRPFLYCDDCAYAHEPGSPVTILSSYHGECRDLWTYECQPQGYMLKVECPTSACEVNGQLSTVHAIWFDPAVTMHGTSVRFPVAGEFPVKFTVNGPNGSTSMSKSIAVKVPDRIEITCYQSGTNLPCSSPLLTSPLTLNFRLLAGTQFIPVNANEFTVTANVPGHRGPPGNWQTDAVGLIAVTVRRGNLVAEFNRTIGPPFERLDQASSHIQLLAQ